MIFFALRCPHSPSSMRLIPLIFTTACVFGMTPQEIEDAAEIEREIASMEAVPADRGPRVDRVRVREENEEKMIRWREIHSRLEQASSAKAVKSEKKK